MESAPSKQADDLGQNSLFLRLPRELRDMIYEYALPYSYASPRSLRRPPRHRNDKTWAPGNLHLVRVCRMMYTEGMEYFYGHNVFPLKVGTNGTLCFRPEMRWRKPTSEDLSVRCFEQDVPTPLVQGVRFVDLEMPLGDVSETLGRYIKPWKVERKLEDCAVALANLPSLEGVRISFSAKERLTRDNMLEVNLIAKEAADKFRPGKRLAFAELGWL